MRFSIELVPIAGGRVEGVVRREGSEEGQFFSGWLELLERLDFAALPSQSMEEPPEDPH